MGLNGEVYKLYLRDSREGGYDRASSGLMYRVLNDTCLRGVIYTTWVTHYVDDRLLIHVPTG
jgi:hypothetical protein